MEELALIEHQRELVIPALTALSALIAAVALRHRGPLPGARALPHALSLTRLVGLPVCFWGLGALAGLMRGASLVSGVHLEAVLLLGALCGSALYSVGRVLDERASSGVLSLYQVLMWGGVCAGVYLSTGDAGFTGFWALCGAGITAGSVTLLTALKTANAQRDALRTA